MSTNPTQDTPGQSTNPPEDYTYINIIPKLGPARPGDEFPSLLPRYGGKPGYVYLQCPVTRQREAQDDIQWKWQPVRDTKIYTIRGPLGQIDCVLLCSGKAIPGTDHQANKRIHYLDPDISEITGLDAEKGLPKLEVKTEEPLKETPDVPKPNQPKTDKKNTTS